MSAVSVAYTPEDNHQPLLVRTDTVDAIAHSRALFKRSMVLSTILHVALLVSTVSFSLVPHQLPAVIATPVDHALDVSMIPISALDTLLPRGAPVPPPSAAPLPSVEQPEPARAPAKPEPPAIPAPRKRPLQEVRKESTKNPIKPQPSAPSSLSAQSSEPPVVAESTGSASSAASASSQPFGVPDGEAIPFERARISYQDVVATRLARVKRYPERAVRRRMTGEGAIRLEISSDGSVAAVQIIRSTNTPILDEELRAMVDRAAPFPAFPRDLRKNRLALIVPITFRLEG